MNRIKELRIQRNLTQDEMGKIINVQKSAVSKYELGRAVPSTDVLKKLANYFNVSTDYLLGLSDQPTAPANEDNLSIKTGIATAKNGHTTIGMEPLTRKTIQAEPLTPEEEAMIRAYREAPTHIRKIVDTALRSEVADEEEKQA